MMKRYYSLIITEAIYDILIIIIYDRNHRHARGWETHRHKSHIKAIRTISILDLTKLVLESNLDADNVDTDTLGRMVEEKVVNNMILVGHLVPYVINNVNITHIIILRRNPYDLREIYQRRGYTGAEDSCKFR